MSLLAPLFLLGMLAIGLPLWLHRLQTQNPERVKISSAMLLEHSEKRLHVQKRLRFLVLLALRIALLLLLAWAFAQPLWRLAANAVPAQGAREHVILIDHSLSMNAPGRMAAALAEANRIVDAMRPADRAQIAAFGSSIELIGTGAGGATSDKALLRKALAQVSAGETRAEFAQAVGAIDSLAGGGSLPVVGHLISDFQATAMSARFADLLPRAERARSIELQLHPVAPEAAPNWSVSGLRALDNALEATVQAHGAPASTQSVLLEVNGNVRGEQSVKVPAGGAATVRFNGVALNAGENKVVARLKGSDALAADDAFNLVLLGGGPQVVPLLTPDVRSATGNFMSAALSVAAARFRVAPTRIDRFDARTLERFRWVAIEDIGAVDGRLASALQSYLASGGAVFASSGARAAGMNKLPVGDWAVTGATTRAADPLGVGRVDGTHALLANTGGWQNIAVARMLKVRPGQDDRVLLSTEDGEPLLLERRVGQGRLLLLTTALDNIWSDLPVEPVFVSFMAEAANWLAGVDTFGGRQVAGANLSLAQSGAAVGQVIDPAGKELLSLSATRGAQNVRLPRAGFYQVVTPARESLVAVNVDARESELTPLDAGSLDNWRKAAAATETVAPPAASAQSEGPVLPLARWLLAVLALVVVAESIAGNWLLRRDARALS